MKIMKEKRMKRVDRLIVCRKMRLKPHYLNYKEIESNEGNGRIFNILVQNLNLAFEFGSEHDY